MNTELTRLNSSSPIAFRGGCTVSADQCIDSATLIIANGQIVEIGPEGTVRVPSTAQVVDASGAMLLPGFIDTHVHGCMGDDVMNAGAEGILRMAQNLCRYGVTAFCPTTLAALHTELLTAVQDCETARRKQQPGSARILGVHLEGPYINIKCKGAQPAEGVRDPDLKETQELLEVGPNLIRMMTLAPELPGADELIGLLVQNGASPSMGHTDADIETTHHAIQQGAHHATHLFNAMAPIHHRRPGIITACLNDPSVTVELITDGVHLDPEIVRMVTRLKGPSRVHLITDAMSALGLPDGIHHLGRQNVMVSAGRCTLTDATLPDGALAGSVHRMDRAFTNIQQFAEQSSQQASLMASLVPAREVGVLAQKGTLECGKDADIVMMRNGIVELTLVGGAIAYCIDTATGGNG